MSGGICFTVAVAYVEIIALNCTEKGNITLYYEVFVTRELRDYSNKDRKWIWCLKSYRLPCQHSRIRIFLMKNGNKALCSTTFEG